MKEDGIDEWSVRKQVEVLQDTLTVLPNTEGRLNDALNDLGCWLEENRDDPSVKDTEQIQEAEEQIVAIREFLENLKLKGTMLDKKDDQVKPDAEAGQNVETNAEDKTEDKPEDKAEAQSKPDQ
eukprot:CAMPEP_0176428268 /NCGR_PEP_ID=MMETSP0127-20121128/13052_1 /TAXON_ID=938130 /ORGANISM="Platyophrya macrostoma, Strain WH" /LENGTH=123 /DNA_ID=CAMNT_0017809925 /DNA_START=125 /DNA_END=496 /DNA_ORIENTATION=+